VFGAKPGGKFMNILWDFDSGVSQPFQVSDGEITFDLRPGQKILNVLIQNTPESFRINLLVDEKSVKFILGQGLLVSSDGVIFRSVPIQEVEKGLLSAELSVAGDEVRVATRYPYGRDALDQLICDTYHTTHADLRLLRRSHRLVPVFDFGQDDGQKLHHYFIAGEDSWETAGCWVADEMVRIMSSGIKFVSKLMEKSIVHIAPLTSPYSATRSGASYTTLEGKGIYGAATWGDDSPPPEYALLREEVTRAIVKKKLGILLTIHSWQSQNESSALETIRTSGENELTGTRLDWASRTVQDLMQNVPHGKAHVAERIWHPGLARDYLLGRYNAVTFRIEVTTYEQGIDGFRKTARKLLENVARIPDWEPVCDI
jgi:hypothetical protein